MDSAMPCEPSDDCIHMWEDDQGVTKYFCVECQETVYVLPALDCEELEGMHIEICPATASDPWTEH